LRDKTITAERRLETLRALGWLGPEAKTAVPYLIDAAQDKQLKDASVGALVWTGSRDARIVPVLMEQFLKVECQDLTGQAAVGDNLSVEDSLVRIGGPAVPALINMLDGPT
jgi:hypothetical protein